MSKWHGFRFTDGLVEASVYLAVVLTPLLVDVNLQRIFVLPKVALVRGLAVVVAAVWLYQAVAERRLGPWTLARPLLRHPLLWPGLAVGLSLVLSTGLSILPGVSLWGGFLRVQGLWTEASYAVLGLAVALHLRTPTQRQRLVDLMLLASWPVALYGLVQFAGLDPLSWVGYTGRVLSTLGNPIFLGAYMALVAPLTLYRLLTLRAAYRAQPTASARLGLVWVGGLLLAQVVSLLLSQSRGPLLAFLLEAGLLVVLLARRRAVVMGLFGVTAVVVLALIVVNVPGSPLRVVQSWPVVGRLTDWRDVTYRDVIWSHTVQLIEARSDRLVVGYGPETLDVALVPFYSTALAYIGGQAQQIDRTHNALLEALVTAGLVGLAAQTWFFLAVTALGLAALGLLRSPVQRWAVYGLPVAGGLALALGTRLFSGVWTWSGLAGGLGVLVELGAALWALLVRAPATTEGGQGDAVLTACLLAGWLGHFAEAQFSPSAETVLLYTWLGLGLLIAHVGAAPDVAVERRDESTVARSALKRKPAPSRENPTEAEPRLADALLMGLMALALVVGLVDWTPPFSLNGHLGVALGLALATWGLAVGWHIWRAGDAPPEPNGPATPAIWQVAYVSLSLVFGGLTLYALGQFVARVALPVSLVYLFLAVGLVGLAWLLSGTPPQWPGRGRGLAVGLGLGLAALAVVAAVAWLPHLADRYFALGRRLAGQGQTAVGVDALARARQLAPDQDVYYLISSDVLAGVAAGQTDAAQQTATFEQARAVARQAMALKPAQPYHAANLAHIELRWAEAATDPSVREAAIQRGLDTLSQVSTTLAFDPAIFDDWGYLLYLRRDFDAAQARYQTALRLQPGRVQTYVLMGRAFREAGNPAAAEESYRSALQYDRDRLDANSELAELLLQQGRAGDALPYAERAGQLAPTRYSVHQTLARVYTGLGKTGDAAEQLRLALRYAPAVEEAKLRLLLQQLTGQ